ncbi:amidohydrolase [Alkalimonas collagenimarina]|uniref:Amidohydrolase n=1 Tax=Alkalimonas collagenimarina TaxID=400390 RepID=A0ABT9GZP8_9GAMM|nr:amidohydrolase [Alkalimonas collagenimarina]MDP4536520.1 amidohydrolase [Alkalimonas collagenimarina]
MRSLSIITAALLISASALAQQVGWNNIHGYGFDSQGQLVQFQQLLVDTETGKVLARGNAIQSDYPDANWQDGQGKTIIPGLIDGHGHILGLGQNLMRVELRGSQSEQEAVERVAEFAAKHPEQQWIQGRGWNQVLWDNNEFPSTALLDEVVSDRPVWLSRIDGHAGWANSKALELAGITKDSLDPPGGRILRDEQGNPTGVLLNNARQYISAILPEPNEAETIQALEAAFTELLSLGITSVHDAGIDSELARLYQRLRAENAIPLRIYAMLSARNPDLQSWLDQGIIDDEHDLLLIRAVKLYGDGALGSRGAALLSDYSDQPEHRGLLVTEPDRLTAQMQATIEAGFQANVHAIGDRANRMVLDRFEQLASPEQLQQGRHRMEHAQIVSPDDIPRFKALHVVPSMQAVHATSDKNMAGDRLGMARLRGAYAWRTFVDQGSPIVGGSDFPVELANPFHGLHASVTRQDQQNQPVGGWLPEQRLSLTEALRSFTRDAAYGAFQEERLGSLAPGMWADFIVLEQNPFAIEAEQLWQLEVLQTWLAGQQVFSR